MSQSQTTVVICARNAASTIARAVESVRCQERVPIIVVDDGSVDDTSVVAVEAGNGLVTIVNPDRKIGLGNARQTGIELIDTEYAMWLDADDALMPGRIEAMERELRSGADIVFDGAELIDSVDNNWIRELTMPDFMLESGAMVRTFERNYLPGPAWPAVRTEVAKNVGYDTALPTGEDIDFNLRALLSSARFKMLPSIGYRQFAYPQSLSRNIELQRGAVKRVMKKHSYAEVGELFSYSGYSERVASWALCSMAIFREEYAKAAMFLGEAFPFGSDPSAILEINGPLPIQEGWKQAFFAGTLELLLEGDGHVKWLELAEVIRPTAEGANNLGVAYHRSGESTKAKNQFELAVSRLKGYRDAKINLERPESPGKITTHPIRVQSSRSEYSIS